MPEHSDRWSRREAEQMIAAIFDAAKAGRTQQIVDLDGTYELRFLVPDAPEPAGEFLAQGGPLEDDDE